MSFCHKIVRLIIGEDIPLNQEGNPANNINDEGHPEPNYVIDQSDIVIPLKIPSGFNAGIKLVHPFEPCHLFYLSCSRIAFVKLSNFISSSSSLGENLFRFNLTQRHQARRYPQDAE